MRTTIENIFFAIEGDRTTGDVESPTGHVSVVHIESEQEARDAYEQAAYVDEDFDIAELIGHFVVVLDDQGLIDITTFESARGANAEFDRLDDEYSTWLATVEDDA